MIAPVTLACFPRNIVGISEQQIIRVTLLSEHHIPSIPRFDLPR